MENTTSSLFFFPYKFHPFYSQANHTYLFCVFIFILYPVFILTFLSNRSGLFDLPENSSAAI